MRRSIAILALVALVLVSGLGPRAVLAAPTFTDVPATYWAYAQIEEFAARGITTGCDTGLYCPERGVTRAEMAVFLDRTLGYFNPPTPASQAFTDVPPGYWAYAFIGQFAALGITTGCAPGEFCPERGVTRAEMAAFLIRALGRGQATPAAPTFADVPTTHPQYGFIEALAALGVTTGCGDDAQGRRLYCPERGVTRAEMAVFIVRAFPLPVASPSPSPSPSPSASPSPSTRPFNPRDYIGQGDRYNCSDFASQAQAQAVLRADPTDPNQLDTNADGIACEGNPAPRDTTPVPRR